MAMDPISFSATQGVAGSNQGYQALTPVSPVQPLPVGNGVQPFLSIPAGTSANNTLGAILDCLVCRNNWNIVITTSSGVSAGVVTLLLSMDGINFVTTSTTVTASGASTTYNTVLTNTPFRYAQMKVTTGITGGTITGYSGAC